MFKKKRATNLILRSVVERVGDAQKFLDEPGQAVIVNRGYVRSVVFSCPDGCGELLTINLDPKAGKAWRLYQTANGVTIFPSVWRDNGCESHFVVWRNKILWCGFDDGHSSSMYGSNSELESKIINALFREKFRSYLELADELNEIPWDILYSCINLARQSKVKRGIGNERDSFKLN